VGAGVGRVTTASKSIQEMTANCLNEIVPVRPIILACLTDNTGFDTLIYDGSRPRCISQAKSRALRKGDAIGEKKNMCEGGVPEKCLDR
jgi:hypothetical protein